jgi:hypothetical protein
MFWNFGHSSVLLWFVWDSEGVPLCGCVCVCVYVWRDGDRAHHLCCSPTFPSSEPPKVPLSWFISPSQCLCYFSPTSTLAPDCFPTWPHNTTGEPSFCLPQLSPLARLSARLYSHTMQYSHNNIAYLILLITSVCHAWLDKLALVTCGKIEINYCSRRLCHKKMQTRLWWRLCGVWRSLSFAGV